MIFALGSTSNRKIASLERVLSDVFSIAESEIVSYTAKSLVSETPHDDETILGAKNRAYDTKKHVPDADYWLGLESGLINRYGQIYEEVWCCVVNSDNNEWYGYSSGLLVPSYIEEQKRQHNLLHHEYLFKEAPHTDDTWGFYSADFINRDISLFEAIRNALIPLFAPGESFYHK